MSAKKLLSMMLSFSMLLPAATAFETVANAEDNNILYYEDFEGDTALDSTIWKYSNHGVVSDGELKIGKGKYPLLHLPDMESAKAYEFSYKIKFEQAGGTWKVYEDASKNQIAFGAAKPGDLGFYWKQLNGVEVPGYNADIDKWYTIKIGFSTSTEKRFTEWTLLDESGEVINTQKENAMFKGEDAMTRISSDAEININDIYFWNVSNDGNVCIDDITLKEIEFSESGSEEPENPQEPENPNEGIVYEEDFEVGNISALLSNGNGWKKNANTNIVDGTLEIPEEAYIYFDMKNKNNDCVYKVSYDIMSPKSGNDAGGLNFVGQCETPWSLGTFNSKKGFAGIKRKFDDSSLIVSGTQAGKWYTIEVTFYERGMDGFIKYTVIDRETKSVLGSIEPDYFQAEDTGDAVSDNTIEFYVWNRDSSGETYYMDNIRFENLGQKPELNADKTVFIDYADNEITDLSGEITPGIKSIVLDFTAKVTEESAASGVKLIDYSTNSEGVEVPVTKSMDDCKYILTLENGLNENAKYAIKVAKSIHTELGENLTTGHTIEFNTGKNEAKLTADGLYTGDAKQESIVSAGSDFAVKASLVNPTQEDGKCVVCVTYYKGNKMVRTELKTVNVSAKSGVNINETFTAPADMTDIDSMQVVFWNDAADMMIYSNAITLK